MSKPQLQSVRLIWSSIVLSVVLFFVFGRTIRPPVEAPDPILFPVLAFAALSAGLASFVVPRLVHAQATRILGLATRDAPGALTPDSPNATQRVFADPEKARAVAPRLFQTQFILSLALSEAVALFGLVLVFRGFSGERTLPFFVASLVLLALRFPSANAAEKALEASARARF